MPIEITPDQVIAWRPCDDWPAERVRSAFAGRESVTPLEVLRAGLEGRLTPQDALWVVCHKDVLPDRIFRIFACDCAYRALERVRQAGHEPDPRSVHAVEVARRHADGLYSDEERDCAMYIAWYVVAHIKNIHFSGEYTLLHINASRSAAWAVSSDASWVKPHVSAWYAALSAADTTVVDIENLWQISHLLSLIGEGA